MTADLHIHTTASDGLFTPASAAQAAKAAGLSAAAVTDHDTTFNCAEFAARARAYGIKPVTGVEFSAYDGDVKVHMLGYGFNPANHALEQFCSMLCEGSFKRLSDIIIKLNKAGVRLTEEEALARRACDGSPVHAMHICRAAAEKGYAKSPFAFYEKYLMPGAAAYSGLCRPSPEEAIKAVNGAGGIAVLAHPGRIPLKKAELLKLISRLAGAGLGGIEAVYSTHTAEETEYFKEIAANFGLYVTGGSDAHFPGGNKAIGKPVFSPSEPLRQRLGI